ncbi:conserved hypothetical protein [Talaromyces stipitatus ATCC 10500]|uniref:Uncharacterized protein n=1 Tax=Talaromyces stipitatus (strain ATCC 10500 / CBS 375.48 / QM 6759 / NRRL 1006) TaxID=441959 RepID=B8LV00_TALSN|nr:uncharacterized protein TSTA_061120 [Talaromyces stipitatus ATCC 10500]EED22621.1 conserved hypothetical protein [Talaromyces stipitatus ATCC 10500]
MPILTWLGDPPSHTTGTTFGVPWEQGRYLPGCGSLVCFDSNRQRLPLQSWINAYWPDGSIKWTGHALPGVSNYPARISVEYRSSTPFHSKENSVRHDLSVCRIKVNSASESLDVDTGKIKIVHSGTGKVVAQQGHLIYQHQSSMAVDEETSYNNNISHYTLKGEIENVEIEHKGPYRIVVRIEGKYQRPASLDETPSAASGCLPFILRFYLYANSDTIRLVHTIIYDRNPEEHFIRGIGIRFQIPLKDEPQYDRHVRFAGEDGIFHEAVQNVTGLWKDPGIDIRMSQISGRPTPALDQWNTDFGSGLRWVPKWNDFTLLQLSPDGYTMRKRTNSGNSWVNIPGGTKANGLVYLGGSHNGGLGIGMRYFWERYPTQLDIRNAATDLGDVTLWIYSPAAGPMDMRPYHDGLGEKTYDDQLDAMRITYEDWEPGTGTPYGISRTNEIYLYAFDNTPSTAVLSKLVSNMRDTPLLIADSEYIHSTKAFGQYWKPFLTSIHTITEPIPKAQDILRNLEFLFNFYQTQIAQRRWYGFWDHGDIMHTYDGDRHTWRYDVGGYAWDNSELSPDLWLWLYFLCTQRADVYRVAESLTRHTSEVDMYHLGPYKGLGTRHGVQHWSDSCKQGRVSNVLYRKFFYYLTGGDERTGQIIRETLDSEKTYFTLDPYRKVRKDRSRVTLEPEKGVLISLGTDWSALAGAWMMEWERKGSEWKKYREKLFNSIKGINSLTNGFVTGQALLHIQSGGISPPPSDPQNAGIVQVGHLSAMFGLVETCAELLDLELYEQIEHTILNDFRSKWLDYCMYYNARSDAQVSRYGVAFPKLILRQGHSRLTAYVARTLGKEELARRAWKEFYEGDGYEASLPWTAEHKSGSEFPVPMDEASWVSTNITALYGLAAIQNIAFVAQYLMT